MGQIIHSLIHGDEWGWTASPRAVPCSRRSVARWRGGQLGTAPDDLVGAIVTGTAAGRPLTNEEKFGYILLLLFGGMDTTRASPVTRSSRCHATRVSNDSSSNDPSSCARRPRSSSGTARRPGLARVVSRDAQFHGQQLKEGERVLLLWASATAIRRRSHRPAEVDLERQPNRHLAFGVGQHRCLGSNLARTMFRVMISEISSGCRTSR